MISCLRRPDGSRQVQWGDAVALDLVDAMVSAANRQGQDDEVAAVERSACPTCGSCSGMFTANSMNCLTEALACRCPATAPWWPPRRPQRAVPKPAAIVELAALLRAGRRQRAAAQHRHFEAFENAMSLDIAMGGSTNTVLHLLAAAREAGVDFTMADIDRISRKVPCLSKVAPATPTYHMEDVHRAGGIGILGELDRAGLIHPTCPPCTPQTWARSINGTRHRPAERRLFRAAPRRRAHHHGLQPEPRAELDSTAPNGCIRRKGSTPIRRTAAWPCCSATSPSAAAS